MGTTMGQVAAGDGTHIAYRAAGPSADAGVPVLLLIHGWAQSSACWGDDLIDSLATGRRVIAMDLRGHGASEPPRVSPGYTAADFSGDVAAVLAAETIQGQNVYLLGWSYGGLVVCDYLAHLDQADRAHAETGHTTSVAGIVLVGAITSMGPGAAGGRIGPAMRAALPNALSDDPKTAVAALTDFVTAMAPLADGPTVQRFLGTALTVAPGVRAGLFGRSADHDDVLRRVDAPVLLIHGTADAVADISCAEHARTVVHDATAHFWDGGGHAPFVEDPGTFASQVEQFLRATVSRGES
jgi:non-heme chloroperoxidase